MAGFDPKQPRNEDGEWTIAGDAARVSAGLPTSEEEYERKGYLDGNIVGAKRENYPVQEHVRAGKLGDCTRYAFEEYQKNGTDVHVGYAALKTDFYEGLEEYKRSGSVIPRFVPHAWNVKDGQIFDRTFGTARAKNYIYFGIKVPDDVMRTITTDYEIARWGWSRK